MAKITLEEQSAPSTPGSNKWVVYPKSDGFYFKDDLGNEYRVLADNHFRYKINVSVSSNDLVVSLTHPDGNAASATRPLWFFINGSWRAVTGSLSITIVDGTNWFNSGSAELGTKLVPYFVYIVWDSNSSVVALSIARIPWGKLVSHFSSTTTNEKHLYNYSNFTSTDDVINIGYFEATLSLSGTSHLWTVPTFTSANLKNEPTFESDWMDWTPAWSGLTSMTVTSVTVTVAKYQFVGKRIYVQTRATAFTIGGTPSPVILQTLPFSGARAADIMAVGAMLFAENGASGFGGIRLADASPDQLGWVKYNAGNWASGAGTILTGNGFYEPA